MSLVLCYDTTSHECSLKFYVKSLCFDCQFRVGNHFVRSVKDMMNGEDINFVSWFFWLPHDSSCTISCMNKKGINSKTRNSMSFKLITSRCNEFICGIFYILMFVPTLLPWFIFSICAAEGKSLMNAFKMQICQGQSFKNRSFVEPCTAFYFSLIVGEIINQNVHYNC